MSYLAGLDIGSALSKAVIVKDGSLVSYCIKPVEGSFSKAAHGVMEGVLEKAGLKYSDISLIGACGLGSSFVPYAFTKVTEISCLSRGINFLLPSVRTLVDVGNQSSKVVKVTENGRVADFIFSDKCAAGSGRILQIISRVIGVKLEDMGGLSINSDNPVKFTTGCAVFLETEAISRVAEGNTKEDIIAGLHKTLAAKISAMAQRMRLEEDCAVTGGGAKDKGLIKAMETMLGKKLLVPEEPLIAGAIGAALIAKERLGIR